MTRETRGQRAGVYARRVPRAVFAFVVVGLLGASALPLAAAESLTPVGTLPEGRDYPSAAMDAAGNVYVFGGRTGGNVTPWIDRFSTTTNTSVRLTATLPRATMSTAAVFDPGAGVAYIFGGGPNGGLCSTYATTDIVRFNPATQTATLISTSLPKPLRGAAAIMDGAGNAYIFGGVGGPACPTAVSATIYRFTPSTGVITAVGALPVPVESAAAVWSSSCGCALVLGGIKSDGQATDIIQSFRPSTGAAAIWPVALPSPRAYMSAVSDGSMAYVFGGSGTGGAIARVPFNGTAVSTSGLTLPGLMAYANAAVWDGRSAAYVVGGSPYIQDVYRYDTTLPRCPGPNDCFESPTDLPSSRPFEFTADLRDATVEQGEPPGCAPTTRTVWFRFTAQTDGHAVVEQTQAAQLSARVAAYRGGSLSSLVSLACGTPGSDGLTIVGFDCIAGTTYRVQVAALGSTTGQGTFVLHGCGATFSGVSVSADEPSVLDHRVVTAPRQCASDPTRASPVPAICTNASVESDQRVYADTSLGDPTGPQTAATGDDAKQVSATSQASVNTGNCGTPLLPPCRTSTQQTTAQVVTVDDPVPRCAPHCDLVREAQALAAQAQKWASNPPLKVWRR